MTIARSIVVATTLAAIASAQNSSATITSPPTTLQTASATANPSILSIMYHGGAIPVLQPNADGLSLPADDMRLQGSVVSVGPYGTVIDVACPYTKSDSGMEDPHCTALDGISYTIAPGTEIAQYVIETATQHKGKDASAAVTADNICTTSGKDAICVATGSVWLSLAGLTTVETATSTQTYNDISYTALTITAGMEKLGSTTATATATATTTGNQSEFTGAAGSFKAGSALVGAAGAFAAAALAL